MYETADKVCYILSNVVSLVYLNEIIASPASALLCHHGYKIVQLDLRDIMQCSLIKDGIHVLQTIKDSTQVL